MNNLSLESIPLDPSHPPPQQLEEQYNANYPDKINDQRLAESLPIIEEWVNPKKEEEIVYNAEDAIIPDISDSHDQMDLDSVQENISSTNDYGI